MEIITDLTDQHARDELMNKCKESFQNRIAELQIAVDNNEKKVAELTEKYMNEINLRKSAEATAEDATCKIEELQNALDSFRERTHALEREMDAYKLAMQERDLQSSNGSFSEELLEEEAEAQQEEALKFSRVSLDEEIFEEIVDPEHEEATRQEKLREEFLEQMNRAVHEQALQLSRSSLSDALLNELEDPINVKQRELSLSLVVLSEKLSQERQNSFYLEDRLSELEKSFHELCELKESIVEEAENQEEWFKALLTKEREQNERLSKESDKMIDELHDKLKDAQEVNSQLMKWKDEVCNSSNFYEETEQKYKEIIAQYETELEEAKIGLCDIRAEVLALRNEQKRSWEEELEDEMVTNTSQKHHEARPLESELSLCEELNEEMEEDLEVLINTPHKHHEARTFEPEVSLCEELNEEMEEELLTKTPQKHHEARTFEPEVSLCEELNEDIEEEMLSSTPRKHYEAKPLDSELSLCEELNEKMEDEFSTSTPQKRSLSSLECDVSGSDEICGEGKESEMLTFTPQKQNPESEAFLNDEIHEDTENEMLTSAPQKHEPAPLGSEVSLREEIKEQEAETLVMYGNQKYRVKLAELIWNGMQNLLNL